MCDAVRCGTVWCGVAQRQISKSNDDVRQKVFVMQVRGIAVHLHVARLMNFARYQEDFSSCSLMNGCYLCRPWIIDFRLSLNRSAPDFLGFCVSLCS